jgi:chaperone modulatory protein CbpM
MMRFDEVVRRCGVSRVELTTWIGRQWIKPHEENEDYLFDSTDVARIDLVRDLHETLEVDDEAMPLVLSLLDQLYATRRLLADVSGALHDLPAPLREEIRRHLQGEPG